MESNQETMPEVPPRSSSDEESFKSEVIEKDLDSTLERDDLEDVK